MAQTMGEGFFSNNPIPPIFVIDGLDVGIFASIDDAVLQLEPVDVQRAEYSAYYAQGRLLQLEVKGPRVMAYLAEANASHGEELSAALRLFLKAMGVMTADDPTCDLACLVEASRKFMYSPPKLWPFRKRI
jgi:hypothetical protein